MKVTRRSENILLQAVMPALAIHKTEIDLGYTYKNPGTVRIKARRNDMQLLAMFGIGLALELYHQVEDKDQKFKDGMIGGLTMFMAEIDPELKEKLNENNRKD